MVLSLCEFSKCISQHFAGIFSNCKLENEGCRNWVKKPNYGTSSKSQQDGKIPALRMGNIQNGKLDWSNLVYTSDEDEIRKYRLYSPLFALWERTLLNFKEFDFEQSS